MGCSKCGRKELGTTEGQTHPHLRESFSLMKMSLLLFKKKNYKEKHTRKPNNLLWWNDHSESAVGDISWLRLHTYKNWFRVTSTGQNPFLVIPGLGVYFSGQIERQQTSVYPVLAAWGLWASAYLAALWVETVGTGKGRKKWSPYHSLLCNSEGEKQNRKWESRDQPLPETSNHAGSEGLRWGLGDCRASRLAH